MISTMPEKTLVFNEGDELPVEGVLNGQPAMNLDNPKDIRVFNKEKREWVKIGGSTT